MVAEINAVGTAYLRLDLLPAQAQAPVRQLFREYTKARVDGYRARNDAALAEFYDNAARLQTDIWNQVTAATESDAGRMTRLLVMPALNDVFDRHVDAVERPERPLPSGRVAASHAAALGAGLGGRAAVAGHP